MANKDYEQKKRECLQEFCKLHDCETPHDYIAETFSYAFNRAYALGKEKETITQEEIEKAAEDYVSFEKGGKCYPSYIVERACCCAFKDGANFALGKQEKDTEDTVIQGWVARASDGNLALFKRKPDREIYRRSNNNGLWFGGSMTDLDSNLFTDLTWESDPQPVEIIIKRKKK